MGDRLYVYMIHDQPIPSIRGHEGNKPRVDFRFKQKNAISDLLTVQRFETRTVATRETVVRQLV